MHHSKKKKKKYKHSEHKINSQEIQEDQNFQGDHLYQEHPESVNDCIQL